MAASGKNCCNNNDITGRAATVAMATFIDFALINRQIGRLDSVKGATNDKQSFDVQ
jgi:hypothetical protein